MDGIRSKGMSSANEAAFLGGIKLSVFGRTEKQIFVYILDYLSNEIYKKMI